VVAGDFGSSTKGDRKRKPLSQQHAPVLEALESLALRSAYHAHFGLAQGEEQDATYWQFRHEDKPFHIDYVFTSPDLTVTGLEVGSWARWHQLSDHAPMIVDLRQTRRDPPQHDGVRLWRTGPGPCFDLSSATLGGTVGRGCSAPRRRVATHRTPA